MDYRLSRAARGNIKFRRNISWDEIDHLGKSNSRAALSIKSKILPFQDPLSIFANREI